MTLRPFFPVNSGVTRAFTALIFLGFLLTAPAEAKRKRIPVVKPVTVSGLTFSVLTQVDERGLDAWLTATVTGKGANKPFRRLVYRISFDPRMETDVQAIYPVSMDARRGVIRVMDERGNYHKVPVVDLTGTVTGGKS